MTSARVVTKSELAEILGVSRSRVAQYLAEGKIGGEALVGTGVRARVRLGVALEQLRVKLDEGQLFSRNGASRQAVTGAAGRASAEPSAPAARDPIEIERVHQAQLKTRQMLRAEALERGRYVMAEDCRRRIGATASEMLQLVEGMLPAIAREVAGDLGTDPRATTHALRRRWADQRAKIAASVRSQIDALPETVLDELAAPAGDDPAAEG